MSRFARGLRLTIFALGSVLSPLAGASFDPLTLAAPSYSCSTSSNGYVYSREGQDVYFLKGAVVNQCQASSYTNGRECSANVACNDGYYPPMVSCSTTSNGYQFRDQCRDPSVARFEAIRQCQASSYTHKQECSANVACEGGNQPPPAPMVTCDTSSNGYRYSDQSRDVWLAKSETIRQCQASSYTTPRECAANVSCNDGSYYAPMITCGTSSNGYQYSDQSRDVWLAKSEAIRHCQASSYTNGRECSANVACNDGGYYPPMVRCRTRSNGYQFEDQSRDSFLARSEAIRQCQASSYTNGQECAANVACQSL